MTKEEIRREYLQFSMSNPARHPSLEEQLMEFGKICAEKATTEKDKRIEELEGQVTRAFEVLESKRKRIEELEQKLEQAEKVKVVEHFEAYGQCRDSRRIAELEAQLEQEKNLSQCRFDHNEQLRETVKKARNLVHRLLVLIQEHKWWNYTVIDEARAFMSEVDRDKDND